VPAVPVDLIDSVLGIRRLRGDVQVRDLGKRPAGFGVGEFYDAGVLTAYEE